MQSHVPRNIINLDSERICEKNWIFGPKLKIKKKRKKLSSFDMESEFHELDNSK